MINNEHLPDAFRYAIEQVIINNLLNGESVDGLIGYILGDNEDDEEEIDNTMRIVVNGEIVDNVDVVIDGSTIITKDAGVIVRSRHK